MSEAFLLTLKGAQMFLFLLRPTFKVTMHRSFFFSFILFPPFFGHGFLLAGTNSPRGSQADKYAGPTYEDYVRADGPRSSKARTSPPQRSTPETRSRRSSMHRDEQYSTYHPAAAFDESMQDSEEFTERSSRFVHRSLDDSPSMQEDIPSPLCK